MDFNKLLRYCDLKMQQNKIEDEMEELRREILTMYPNSTDIELQDYTLKVVYQDRKNYNDQLLFDSLPDAQLWRNVSKADGAKITALLKSNIISQEMIDGTYTVSKVPYLYVHKQIT